MVVSHNRSTAVSEFVLICFPGIENWQHWLSIPITLLFLVVLAANVILILTICSSPRLHTPMFYLLSVLAMVDLLMNFTVAPKALVILWLDEKTISSLACFTQIFILYFCRGMETSIFVCLAYDRYVAICNPLRHSAIITSRTATQAVTVVIISNTVIFLPYPLLAARLHYCAENVVPHCMCENLPLARLACDSSTANNLYSSVITSINVIFLTVSLAFSYGMILRAWDIIGDCSICAEMLLVSLAFSGKSFSEVYVPGKDECFVLFKGLLVFKQYIPSKRARY
ncbi:olfactory receptor 56A4-like [Pleurodeles waltl]|uniref:olfactory receptor 56A4-like n=1 Tax=Pleurodeles waltl TaxID=8319 RepID=UPI00370999D5